MFGLIISVPGVSAEERGALLRLLDAVSIGAVTLTDAPSPVPDGLPMTQLLPRLALALLTPGTPLPFAAVAACFGDDPRPVNVLRKHLYLQLSLLPYLRANRRITPLESSHMLGDALLIPAIDSEGRVSCPLPDGVWTDLLTGECHTGLLRRMRSLSLPLVLVRENTLLPIGVNDRVTDADDADRVTLHWFQPQGHAACVLADGTRFEASLSGASPTVTTGSTKPWHLILRQDGEETLVR